VDNEYTQSKAQSQEDEPILVWRVIWIIAQECALIRKDRHRLSESDFVLPLICKVLRFIPFEPQPCHGPNITTM